MADMVLSNFALCFKNPRRLKIGSSKKKSAYNGIFQTYARWREVQNSVCACVCLKKNHDYSPERTKDANIISAFD